MLSLCLSASAHVRTRSTPITGGMSWPLPPAAVLMPPATSGFKATRSISVIVMEPIVAVLAMDEPVRMD